MAIDLTLLDADKVVDVDLMDGEVTDNWTEYASQWALSGPFYIVNHGIPQVMTGRYEDVRAVLTGRESFTAQTPAGHPMAAFDIFMGLPQLNAMEGESHNRLRRLMMPFFSAEGIAAFQSQIAALVRELLDAVDANDGRFDGMGDFAVPLVERTLLEVLYDVEPEQHAEFVAYSRVMPLSLRPTADGEYNPEFVEQFERTTGVIERLLDARRTDPRDDLITTFVREQDAGFPVSHDEVVGNILAVYAGAQLATATSIGVLLMNLARHPDQYRLLRENLDLAPAAVEESLRVHPAGLTGFPRYALDDTELGGLKIWKDMTVHIGLAAANLDPQRYPDPLHFDIQREGPPSLAFSMGAHQCIGNRIARMMMTETASELARRYQSLRTADPAFEPTYGGVLGELKPDTVPLIATLPS